MLRDHLGNGRVYFSDKNEDSKIQIGGAESELLQEEHYYPFGLNHDGPFYQQQPVTNQYQYNGKELNEEFGLEWNDYGARFYDPAVGRWWSVDPLAEDAYSWTPFRYGFNNPILYIDPDGLFETELQAREYAKEKGIKTGWLRKNKIREQEDGSFAIENKKNHSSTYDLGEGFGVVTAAEVTPTDVMSSNVGRYDGHLATHVTLRDGTESITPVETGTAPTPNNLNNNKAIAEFSVYVFRLFKKIFKVGKAHSGRITKSSGLPTRVHQQRRKLIKKYGKENVDVTVSSIGKTTTKNAKRVESSILKKIFKRTGKVPQGNRRSFKPKKKK